MQETSKNNTGFLACEQGLKKICFAKILKKYANHVVANNCFAF